MRTRNLIVDGTDNTDNLFRGRGDDIVNGEDGSDMLLGGAGMDVFVFSKGVDIVRDFDVFDDMIDVSASRGIVDFEDLADNHMSEADGKVTIAHNGHEMILYNTQLDDLDAFHFLF